MGFVERVDEYAEALPAAGLTAPSAHAKLVGQDLEPIFEAAVRLGVSTVIDPHIDETRWITREDVEAVAAELGEVAEAARAHGLTVGYHNHAFELENLIDGTPPSRSSPRPSRRRSFSRSTPTGSRSAAWTPPNCSPVWETACGSCTSRTAPRRRTTPSRSPSVGARCPSATSCGRPAGLAVVELDDHNGDVFTALEQSYSFLDGVRA